MKLEALRSTLGMALARRGMSWRALAVLLVLIYVTPIGGTRAGTYHFPLVASSHLLIFVALAAWVARSLVKGRWLPKTPLDVPILAFYVLNLVSAAFSAEKRLSVENVAHLTLLLLAYYMVVDMLLSGWKTSEFVVPMLLVAAVVVTVEMLELAVWLGIWVAGTGEFSPVLALSEYRRRLVMGPANVRAWYVVLIMPLILARMLRSSSRRERAQLGVLALAAMIVLASTLSRSGLIGMAVAVAAFSFLMVAPRFASGSSKRWAYLRRPPVVGSLLAAAALGAALMAFSFNLLSSRFYTVSIRVELWRAAAAIIRARPLVGGGPGTFGYLFHQLPDSDPLGPETYYNNAHNGFINMAAESGVPSLAAGLWLIWALLGTGWRSLSHGAGKPSGQVPVVAGCLAGLLGLMASTLFDVPWVFPLTTVHVILLAAIVVGPASAVRTAVARPLRWANTSLAILAAMILCWSDVAHAFQQHAVDATQAGKPVEALTALESSITWDPALSIYPLQLGMVEAQVALANHDSALLDLAARRLEEEIGRGGDTALNNSNLAWLEREAGRAGKAVARMERAASQAPRDGYYLLGLGYLLEETGDFPGAKNAYTQAVQRTPELIDSGFWHTSPHRSDFKAGLETQDGLPHITRAWAYLLADDPAGAMHALQGVGQHGSGLVLWGRVESAIGNYPEAERHLEDALTRSPGDVQAYLARGKLYLEKGDRELALRDLRTAGLLGDSRADLLLGEVAFQEGNLEKAIALLRNHVPGCRSLTASYDYASQVYHRSDIRADFWPAIIICAPQDHSVPYYLHLATAYRSLDRANEAEDVCRWLGAFYGVSYLEELVSESEVQNACPLDSDVGAEGQGKASVPSSLGYVWRGAFT